MTFFRTENLSLAFSGLKALQNVSFSVSRGQLYSIIGPNGAGKTTLFNCINSLWQPDQGNIFFKKACITGMPPYAIARLGIGRTFQNIELFRTMNTIDNLMLGRHRNMKTGLFSGMFMWGSASSAAREETRHRERIEQLIEFLDLKSVRDAPVSDLSYGIQKRIELGRALAMEPELLLLDEPFAGMSREEKQALTELILEVKSVLDITILMIEHDMTVVMEISDRILVMNFGKLIFEGSPKEVQRDLEVQSAFLGQKTNDNAS